MIATVSQSIQPAEFGVRLRASRTLHCAKSAALFAWIVLSGAGMAANLASPIHPWWAWLSPLPLFVAIRYWRPSAVLIFGAAWGASTYAFSTTVFIHSSFVPGLRSLLFLSMIPAVYGFLGSWLSLRMGFSALFLGVGWIAVELALIPLGMRTGLLVGAYEEGTILAIMEGVLGYAFVAFAVAWINGLLVFFLGRVIRLACTNPHYRPLSTCGPIRQFIHEAIVDFAHIEGGVHARAPPIRGLFPTKT